MLKTRETNFYMIKFNSPVYQKQTLTNPITMKLVYSLLSSMVFKKSKVYRFFLKLTTDEEDFKAARKETCNKI